MRPPIDPGAAGKAPHIQARIPRSADERLARLMLRHRKSRSAMLRELLIESLDRRMEQEPADSG